MPKFLNATAISLSLILQAAFGQNTPAADVVGNGNFSHIVTNLDKSIAFYRDVLGLELPGGAQPFGEKPEIMRLGNTIGAQNRIAVLRVPGSTLGVELIEYKDIDRKPAHPRFQDPGAANLTLRVRDIDAVMARVKSSGAKVLTAAGGPVAVGTSRNCFVQDPDGFVVELAQPVPAPQAAAGEGNLLGAGLETTVMDTEQTVRFYRDLLGFQLRVGEFNDNKLMAETAGAPGAQFRQSSGQIPGSPVRITFIEFKGIDRKPLHTRLQDPGSALLQLRVRDVDALVKKLKAGGAEIISAGGEPVTRGNTRLAIVRDPNNLFLELISGPQATADAFPATQGKAYKFEKVAEGVYYATGGVGSNNVVIVNDRDVVLVDDGTTPAAARALLEDIKTITDKPVRTVINTHFHYDHTDGNSVFGPDVQIIAHEYVRTAILNFNVLEREPFKTSQSTRLPVQIALLRQQLASATDAAQKKRLANDLAAAESLSNDLREVKPTPPNVTYASKMVLYRGGREIQLLFLGRGHTGGDTFVYLPQERIVCTGDMEEGARVAYMGDAYFDEWIASLEALKKLDFTLVLPGHGVPFRDKSVVTAFQSYLRDLTGQVAVLRKQGVTPEEAAKQVDLTSHQKDFSEVRTAGADLRGVRRIYEWMDETKR
jgi:glyoxylase-like metal-dependent hydrolase (beta-lactamase superfamily II)/predicted enzyme related to lactoylglutathione lyase